MITNSQLGYTGRLGNQMYQFGFLWVLSKKHGYQIEIPLRNVIDYGHEFTRLELFSVFSLKRSYLVRGRLAPARVVEKWGVVHFEDAFEIEDDSDVHGSFQSARYFLPYRRELMELYQFVPVMRKACERFMQTLDPAKEIVGIHVRRGDYVDLESALDRDYYHGILQKHFPSDRYQVVCVSDDISWCRENFPGAICFSGEEAGVDMCFLTRCHHLICSNSTFSWWSAFLNPNGGKVFMPRKWFSDVFKKRYPLQYDEAIFFYDGILHE